MSKLIANERSMAVRLHNAGHSLEHIARRVMHEVEDVEEFLKSRQGYPDKIIALKAVDRPKTEDKRKKKAAAPVNFVRKTPSHKPADPDPEDDEVKVSAKPQQPSVPMTEFQRRKGTLYGV